jgi:ferredoxin-nitrite reductase
MPTLLAGFDPNEVVDTRPHTRAIQDYVTGGGRGNPDIANLGRKWNVCVVGGPDFYEHPDINDLAFIPAERDGVVGFNMIVGGFISSARAAESIPLGAWVPESEVVAATAAVITTFRDYGHRGNRQKCRMMWLVEEMGVDKFRDEVASRMPTGELAPAAEKDLIDESIARRSYLGVHKQKQEGLNWVGACCPGGRLQADDLQEMADLADMYGSGELRLTVEQNFIIPNVPDAKVDALLAEPLLKRYTTTPGNVVAGMVACTGAQFCGFAQIETKKQGYTVAEHLESVLDFPNGDIRMIWTGCPNSCAPVQVADIGLMGCQMKNPSGEKGMVQGVNIFIGGTVGPGGHLKEHPEIEKVALTQLHPVLEVGLRTS